MTLWSVIVELDIPDEMLEPARRAITNAVRFETGTAPTTRTIRSDAFHAALGHPYVVALGESA